MELSVGGKLHNMKCAYCGKEDVWLTEYINLGAPNVECRSCGEKWIECPETKLHINNSLANKSTQPNPISDNASDDVKRKPGEPF